MERRVLFVVSCAAAARAVDTAACADCVATRVFVARRRARSSRRALTVRLASARGDGAREANGDSAKIVRNIAQCFVDACVPGPRSYEECLKDFIRAVLAAYRKGFSLTALQFELQAERDAGTHRLAQDELELRTLWTSLIFKTLRKMNVRRDQAGGEELVAVPDAFDSFVAGIISAVKSGYDLARIQLEQSVANNSNTDNASDQGRRNFEAAVLRQSTRIVYNTVAVISDEADS